MAARSALFKGESERGTAPSSSMSKDDEGKRGWAELVDVEALAELDDGEPARMGR